MKYDPFKEYAIDQLISEGLIEDAWDATGEEPQIVHKQDTEK